MRVQVEPVNPKPEGRLMMNSIVPYVWLVGCASLGTYWAGKLIRQSKDAREDLREENAVLKVMLERVTDQLQAMKIASPRQPCN